MDGGQKITKIKSTQKASLLLRQTEKLKVSRNIKIRFLERFMLCAKSIKTFLILFTSGE